MDFISGLILTVVALGSVVYVVKELLSDRIDRFEKTPRDLARKVTEHLTSEAKPANDHLIGATGKVIGHSDASERPLRVRIGSEFWPAKPDDTVAASQLPIGATVEVREVDGSVVVVSASTLRPSDQQRAAETH